MTDRPALDRGFLADIGLGGLPDTDQRSLLEALAAELELRVGTRLATAMTSQQIATFDSLISAGDETAARDYLGRVVPWRGEAVREEMEALRTLLGNRAAEIVDALGGCG